MAPTGTLLPAGDFPCNPAPKNSALEPCDIRNQPLLLELFTFFQWGVHTEAGFCWAYNAYLTKRFKRSVATISRAIARLALLGAVEVEQIPGKERRIRLLTTRENLEALLFRGHPSNRLAPEPARRPSRRSKRRVEQTVAETVEEGLPYKAVDGVDDNTHTPAVVVAPPTVEPSPEALAILEPLGLSKAACRSLARQGDLKRLRSAARAYLAADRRKIRNPAAWLTEAIRNSWQPPTRADALPEAPRRRIFASSAPVGPTGGRADWEALRSRMKKSAP